MSCDLSSKSVTAFRLVKKTFQSIAVFEVSGFLRQGLQLMSDCVTFGGFTDAFLTAFRDEFPKLPSLAFSFLSNASNVPVTAEEVWQAKHVKHLALTPSYDHSLQPGAAKAINDALCLLSLENLSTLNVPIQHPSTWKQGGLLENLSLDVRLRSSCLRIPSPLTLYMQLRSPYQTSALVSTHIETATLPLRWVHPPSVPG